MSVYFICTTLDPNLPIPEKKRSAHLEYIGLTKKSIREGGLTTATGQDYTGICYFVELENIELRQ